MSKGTINILVALGVAAILLYLLEESTLLVALALGGLGYLLFANKVVGVQA